MLPLLIAAGGVWFVHQVLMDPPFPIGEGRATVAGVPVLERHWVPNPDDPSRGIVYIMGRGDAEDLANWAKLSDDFLACASPITDDRMLHTDPDLEWWRPAEDPAVVCFRDSRDHPLASPEAESEAELIISSNDGKIFHEQRTFPLRNR